jgi:ABC-type transport system involved in cytochrome c biogenesis ATPase subunit
VERRIAIALAALLFSLAALWILDIEVFGIDIPQGWLGGFK